MWCRVQCLHAWYNPKTCLHLHVGRAHGVCAFSSRTHLEGGSVSCCRCRRCWSQAGGQHNAVSLTTARLQFAALRAVRAYARVQHACKQGSRQGSPISDACHYSHGQAFRI